MTYVRRGLRLESLEQRQLGVVGGAPIVAQQATRVGTLVGPRDGYCVGRCKSVLLFEASVFESISYIAIQGPVERVIHAVVC